MIPLAKLKMINRNLNITLEQKRKLLENKKLGIEKLQLLKDNLLYKKSYLHREIRSCQDLITPSLDEIEKERSEIIVSKQYQPNLLSEFHEIAKATLKEEEKERILMKSFFDEKTSYYQKRLEVLDRKRKFVDEFPSKVSKIRASTTELIKEFDEILPSSGSSSSSSSSLGEVSPSQSFSSLYNFIPTGDEDGDPLGGKEEGEIADDDNQSHKNLNTTTIADNSHVMDI
jgi:hypothetical protein